MATQAKLPAEFLTAPDVPTMSTELYIEELQNYLLAAGTCKFTEDRKVAILNNIVGFHTRKVLRAASAGSPPATVTEFFDLLRTLFPENVSYTIARDKFNKRMQRHNETVLQFFTEISELSDQCNFGSMRQELLKDKLVLCLRKEIREKLILEQPTTMKSALELAQKVEIVHQELQTTCISNTTLSESVNTVSNPIRHDNAPKFNRTSMRSHATTSNSNRRVQPPSPNPQVRKSTKYCFRCGDTRHLANDPSCKAINGTCRKCGVRGHYGRVCFGPKGSKPNPADNQDGVHSIFSNSSADSSAQSSRENVPVLSSHMKFIDVDCSTVTRDTSSDLDACKISFGVDTGASVSLMSFRMYKHNFSHVTLYKPDREVRNFSGAVLHVHGVISLKLRWRNFSCEDQVYVVDIDCSPLLGIRAFEKLQIFRLWTDDLHVHVNSLGCVSKYMHKINLRPDSFPVRQKLRRIPLHLRSQVSEELQSMVHDDIIEPIQESEWASNLVIVQKPTGKLRICVDLRDLNKSLITHTYPLPHTDEVFLKLKDCSVFSVIDLKHAFLQVPLHPDSRQYTAFVTHDGLFQYKRIPMGLASAPCSFQRLITEILGNREGVQAYMDDILIGGRSLLEHDNRLKNVLKALQDAGFQLNTDKSILRQQEIKFMGHILSSAGVRPDPQKVDSIVALPPPTSPAEIKSFVGMTAYYSKFIPNHSSLLEPLLQLTRKNVAWTWGQEQQTAYDTLRKLIAERTTLSIFKPERTTEIQVDASGSGLGAVLLQRDSESNMHIIAFASRTLTPAERNYAIIEREALAIAFAVERWKVFLWGHTFTIATDHRPLVSIFNSRDTLQVNQRISRFVQRLLPYQYCVYYKAGPENVIADFFSRVLPTNSVIEDASPDLDNSSFLVNSILSDTSLSRTDLQNATKTDPEMKIIQKWLAGSAISDEEKRIVSHFQSVKHELCFVANVLLRGTERIVPPRHLRNTLIQLSHEAHQGQTRTFSQLQLHYWWPRMFKEVQDYVSTCSQCNESAKTTKFVTVDPVKIDVPEQPWTKIGIDLIGPMYDLSTRNRYAITLMDYTSKFPYMRFLSQIDSRAIIDFLISVFAVEGYPDTVVSDNGPQFISKEFTDFLHQNSIQHLRTPVYHARANGLIERWNRTIKYQIDIAKRSHDFYKYISNFLAAFRSTPHNETKVTPSFLLHGRQMRWSHNIPASDPSVPLSYSPPSDQGCYRHPTYSPGEEVRVQMPDRISSRTVRRKVGPHTYEMTDNHCWHTSRMSKKKSSLSSRQFKPTLPYKPSPPPPRYPRRNRGPPSRYILQDT